MISERKRLTPLVRTTLAFQQKYLCGICSEILPPIFHIDHVVPLSLGGSNDHDNLQCLCVYCHVRKTSEEATARAGRTQRKPGSPGEPMESMEPEPMEEMESSTENKFQRQSPFFAAACNPFSAYAYTKRRTIERCPCKTSPACMPPGGVSPGMPGRPRNNESREEIS